VIAEAFREPVESALRQFGIAAASVKLAAQAENVTFKVTAENGNSYTLRFHRSGYHELEELEAERLWTQALTQAGINVPKTLSAPDGRHYLSIEVPALQETRWVGLAHWVEGEVLLPILRDANADANHMCDCFHRLGAMIAAMHNQASAWRPPAQFHRRCLDASGLAGSSPYWGPFWEHEILSPEERALFIRVRDRLHGVLSGYGREGERFSVIHADLHPGNILLNGDTLAAIDFDDTAFGWHMFDVAVALHQCQDLPFFPQLYASCVEGYRAVRPVSEDDLRMIPNFLLMRGLAEIGWFADRPENTTPEEMMAVKDFVVAQCHDFEAGTLTAEVDAFRTRQAA
jgi:Ser/Thr protein kinase RdoA (MazF antagonist)